MNLIELKPKIGAKYHFGEFGLENSSVIFHSDSLFSAIINNYVKLYGDAEEDIEKLKSIRLSSLFPAYQDIFFVPKPFTRLNFDKRGQERADEKPKEIKSIEFISLNALENHNKEILELEDEDEIDEKEKKLIVNKKFLITKEDKAKVNDREINISDLGEQKQTIDRNKGSVLEVDGRGQLFNVGYIKPSEGTYFYFLIDDSELDDDMREKLHASIRLIQDEGLGGKRTTGAGLFESIEFCGRSVFDDYISSNSDKKYFMSLSLTLPENEEEFKKCEAYHLIERMGYIYRPIQTTKRKRSVMMLSEGSIFSGGIEGKVENVSPESNYKVYKFGNFFGIPINVNQNDRE